MKNYFKKILCELRTIGWSIRQLFIAASLETSGVILFVIFQGLIPASSLYAIQGIIDWISMPLAFPFVFVGLWGGMQLADTILTPIIAVIRLHLNEKILAHFNILLMEKAHAIESLIPFENAKFYDEMQFLKNEASRRPLNFVYVLTAVIKSGISLLSVLILLSTIEWWIPVAIFIVSLPHAYSTFWFEKQSWDQLLFRSPESRKMAWVSSLLLEDRIAKEVRLFGFGHFLIKRYKDLVKMAHFKHAAERWKKSGLSMLISSFSVIGNVAIIGIILMRAKEGSLLLGGVVIAIQALIMTQLQLVDFIANLGMCTQCLLFFNKFRDFIKNKYCFISENCSKNSTDSSMQQPYFFNEIRFNNVSFSYADGRKALTKVSFTLKKGDKLAIIGENGAGKSTIVKLLLRFYDPSEGSITVDGKDLKNLDLKMWRSSISGVFQDFGQYHFSISENIALGDVKASAERIAEAAFESGCQSVIDRLPEGINTLLGKEFGGTALSGGEWQRLAMSRAFIREAHFLVLDEPTASLDPQTEQEIFKKFSDLAIEKTVLLITHRLGSIKMANRILVFKEGHLIEEGTHQELIKAKKEFFSLFTLQADQYKEESCNSNIQEQK